MEYGLKLTEYMHFGDALSMSPIVKYLSQSHNAKLLIETNQPHVFKNNPYVKKIFNITLTKQFTIATYIVLFIVLRTLSPR